MAKLKGGTRVYGNLTVDSSLTSAQLNVSGGSVITGITTSTYLDGTPINELSGAILAISYGLAMP